MRLTFHISQMPNVICETNMKRDFIFSKNGLQPKKFLYSSQKLDFPERRPSTFCVEWSCVCLRVIVVISSFLYARPPIHMPLWVLVMKAKKQKVTAELESFCLCGLKQSWKGEKEEGNAAHFLFSPKASGKL